MTETPKSLASKLESTEQDARSAGVQLYPS